MNQQVILMAILFLLFSIKGESQNLSVESFEVLPNDQTARVHEPVKDQNGEKCALIKVVTGDKGFVWEGGTLGISKVKKKTGEYWVYLPHGSKKITIKHDKLGVLRNYIFPKAIKKATVYEMELITGDVKTVVEKPEIESVWLMINSKPEGSDVYINDVYYGITPLQKKLTKEKHTYRINKQKYKPKAGSIDLTKVEDKRKLNVALDPNFGTLEITSRPEQDAKVFIDGRNTGKTTPCTIDKVIEGEHKIELRKKLYEPKIQRFSIQAAEKKSVTISMNPVYGTISIHSTPNANIYIDNEKIGYGSKDKKLTPGVYTITARKDKHYADEKNIEIQIGDEENIQLQPKPKYGEIDITTTPWEAKVYIDGEKKGTTPVTIDEMLVGEYTLEIRKEGYKNIEKQVEIEQGETFALKETLTKGENDQKARDEKTKVLNDEKTVSEKQPSKKLNKKEGGQKEKEEHVFCNYEFGYLKNWNFGIGYIKGKFGSIDEFEAQEYRVSLAKRMFYTNSYQMHIFGVYTQWNWNGSQWNFYRLGFNNQVKNFGLAVFYERQIDANNEGQEQYFFNEYAAQVYYSPKITLADDTYLAFTPSFSYRLNRFYDNNKVADKSNFIIGQLGLVFILNDFSIKTGYARRKELNDTNYTDYLQFGINYTF